MAKIKKVGYMVHGFKLPRGYDIEAFATKKMAKQYIKTQKWKDKPKISPISEPASTMFPSLKIKKRR